MTVQRPGWPDAHDERQRLTRPAVSIAGARRRTRVFLDALVPPAAAEAADTVVLVVSELVTNALLHGGGTCTVELTALPDGIEVAVHDPSPQPPRMRTPALTDGTAGFGWPMVDQRARTTAVTPGPYGGKKRSSPSSPGSEGHRCTRVSGRLVSPRQPVNLQRDRRPDCEARGCRARRRFVSKRGLARSGSGRADDRRFRGYALPVARISPLKATAQPSFQLASPESGCLMPPAPCTRGQDGSFYRCGASMCRRMVVPRSGVERISTRSQSWCTSHRPRPPIWFASGRLRPVIASGM